MNIFITFLFKKKFMPLSYTLFLITIICCVQSKGLDSNKDKKESEKEDKITWYRYEPAEVVLEGKLILKDYPGPPNYSEDSNSKKEKCYILQLHTPINIKGDKLDEINSDTYTNVSEIQLVKSNSMDAIKNKQIKIKGTLFQAHTGHHHTDVLMEVKKIYLKNENDSVKH